jgi:hypothetical protein
VQLELPWALGPADGRYVLRGPGGEPEHVIVLVTLGAPQRHLLGGRRARSAAAQPPPVPVTTTRATVVAAAPQASAAEARALLAARDLGPAAAAAVELLNRVLHLHRTATADPWLHEVALEHAIAVRVGIGEGEQVAEGRWTQARELPRARRGPRRSAALRPQERLAALLGGRDAPLAAEELALRARADVAAGRGREAALQLRVALAAARHELEAWGDRGDLGVRLEELRALAPAVDAAAERALRGGLDADSAAEVERALGRLEAALRARTALGPA